MTLSNLNDIFELFKENVMGCIMSIILAGVIQFVKNMRANIAKFSNLRNRKIIDSVIAVSYTHLDVYKRQAMIPIIFADQLYFLDQYPIENFR